MLHVHLRGHAALAGTRGVASAPAAAPAEGWLRGVLLVVGLAQICVSIASHATRNP